MTSPIRVLRQLVAPTGRHPQPRPVLLPDAPLARTAVTVTVVPEAALLAGWPKPDLAPGAVVRQKFVDCPKCDGVQSGVVTEDGTWRCSECSTHVLVGGA